MSASMFEPSLSLPRSSYIYSQFSHKEPTHPLTRVIGLLFKRDSNGRLKLSRNSLSPLTTSGILSTVEAFSK